MAYEIYALGKNIGNKKIPNCNKTGMNINRCKAAFT